MSVSITCSILNMDLASAPQFQGVGADWDALMKAADSLDPDAPLPRKRVSDADAYKAFVDEEHDELATLSALIPGTTLSSKRVGMQTLWRFIQWHKLHYPPTATHPGGEFTDRERDAKSILRKSTKTLLFHTSYVWSSVA